VKFNQGVTFDFATAPVSARYLAPGARVVVVANSAAFNSRLAPGAAPNIAGTYTGQLSNNGETLACVDASNLVLKSFAYGDSAPWPRDADGRGRSLVLNNPFTNPDHTLAIHWRPSAQTNGAPGAADAEPPPANPLADDNANGFSNLYDYALGPGARLTITTESNTPPGGPMANYLYFRHSRDLFADGFSFSVEHSLDLSSWSPSLLTYVSTVVNTGGLATVTYRSLAPASVFMPTVFVRLRVQP
jgi:hypothetical protein